MQSFRPARRIRSAVLGLAVLALAVGVGAALADDGGGDPQPVDFSHNAFNAPAPVTGAVFGSSPSVKTGTAICTTATSNAANVNTDCEGQTTTSGGPHNETSIAVNPTNPDNMIGGANDYQLALNPAGQTSETILSRAHVTFDGGKSWANYPVFSTSTWQATGDPALAFDAAGNAYYGTLGFRFVGSSATNPDVLVSTSPDGGKTWDTHVIAAGSGNEGSVGDLLDKEYVAAWGNGNAIVTYGDFRLGQRGSFVSAQIYASVTHDAGVTWSTPQVISGSLDEAFVAVPAVAADGSIYVAFLNTTDLNTGRDDYEVVRVDPATGTALTAPTKVATVIDGATDYPIAFGRQTYQDSVFRSWAAGNITADPTNAQHLAVVWSDMRNSQLPAPSDPYSAKTNSDVIVSESFDGGAHWTAPTAVALRGDQFMPWGAFDAGGVLRIGTFDRSYDRKNHKYGYTLLTESSKGFAAQQVTTTLSDPTTGDRWFARTVNAKFPNATAFLGDYSNIAAAPGGGVVAYWTDMREQACFGGSCRSGEDAYFARVG
ncbi:MAG TPA: sialidase family protein [Gaiellaceae bacterium]|nr:sialidase family protein [Gaiellaceae bacterium]